MQEDKETDFFKSVCDFLIPVVQLQLGNKLIPPFAFTDKLFFALHGVTVSNIIEIDVFLENNFNYLKDTSFRYKLEILLGVEKANEMERLFNDESKFIKTVLANATKQTIPQSEGKKSLSF